MSVTDRLEQIEANSLAAHAAALGNRLDVRYLLSLVRTQAAEIERLKAVLEAARTSVQAVREYGSEVRLDWSGLDGRDIRDRLLEETEPVVVALARLEEQA